MARSGVPVASRPCAHCGVVFTPVPAAWKTGRFCSKACRSAGWLAENNAKYRARMRTFRLVCAECSTSFTFQAVTPRLSGPKARRFCTHQCKTRYQFRQKYNAGGGRRFGRVQGKARVAVFENANWHCQLCGALIDPRLTFPSPGSPSIDHIIPLADGGPHEPSNWQAAHLICNIDKGNARRRKDAA